MPFSSLSPKKTRKNLAKRATPQENKLWSRLKQRALGYPFIRNHVHGPYTVDFCCIEKQLVIDIDGWKRRDNRDHAKARAEYFSDFGFTVLCFWNNDIDENIDGVVQKIQNSLH